MIERDDNVDDIEDGTTKVMNENYAFIIESHALQTWTEEQFCSIEQVGERLNTIFHGIAVKKSETA